MDQTPPPTGERKTLKIVVIVIAVGVLLFCACPLMSAFFIPFFT